MSNDITKLVNILKNKYSDNFEYYKKSMYDLGLIFSLYDYTDNDDAFKLVSSYIREKSKHDIRKIRRCNRKILLNEFSRGIKDGISHDYTNGVKDSNKKENLYKRGYIDGLIKNISSDSSSTDASTDTSTDTTSTT